MLAVDPPDLSSPEALARWGFRMHNQVNRRLGKPEITFEDAAARWSWDFAAAEQSRNGSQ